MNKKTLGSIMGALGICGILLVSQSVQSDLFFANMPPQNVINIAAAEKPSEMKTDDGIKSAENRSLLSRKKTSEEFPKADELAKTQKVGKFANDEPTPPVNHVIEVSKAEDSTEDVSSSAVKKEAVSSQEKTSAKLEKEAQLAAVQSEATEKETKEQTNASVKSEASEAKSSPIADVKAVEKNSATGTSEDTKKSGEPAKSAAPVSKANKEDKKQEEKEQKNLPDVKMASASAAPKKQNSAMKAPTAANADQKKENKLPETQPVSGQVTHKEEDKLPDTKTAAQSAEPAGKGTVTASGVDTSKDRKGEPMDVKPDQKLTISDLPDMLGMPALVVSQPESKVSYAELRYHGVINWGGYKFTFYSQSVLPGGGLKIPGRHVEGGYVCDGNGDIVLANDLPRGTRIPTPFSGKWGKVYDRGTHGNHFDVYVE